uniref:ATP-dependent DNA helicase n=1 Tax=Elaeis guineensis var. tenera TaxID=51953 RepID=A0A6I9QLU8_ELAGV
MAHKHCFEVLDYTLRDILRSTFLDSLNKPFGGMTMILRGDFHQILLVVSKGRREDIVGTSTKSSYRWQHFEIYLLHKNMHLENGACTSSSAEFAQWILNVRDGKEASDVGEQWIEIPREIMMDRNCNAIQKIIEFTYQDVATKLIDKNSTNSGDDDALYPIEFLNSLKFAGMPNHALRLNNDVPIMLLRNVNQSAGLCNGTRLIVTQLGK